MHETPIQQFYHNSVIFITGGTGFIGTVIIEKLLRDCPDIKKIYLLIRNKRQISSEQRLKDLFQGHYWDTLKVSNSKFEQQICLISGDLLNENLGISSEDYITLTDEVNIIFHVAATVRFDEALKVAAQLNIKATKCMLKLAEKCANLKSFVHVSTAYMQCATSSELFERFYPVVRNPDEFLQFCDAHTKDELDALTPSILKEFPNTYTFTKCLTEDLVRKYDKVLPIAITRPSIVMSIYREPIPGWFKNFYGPLGIMIGIAAGLLRVVQVDLKMLADIVPGDLCANHIISVAYETSKTNYKEQGIQIYNYASGNTNPLTWSDFENWNTKFAAVYGCLPLNITLGFFHTIYTTNIFLTIVLRFLLHTVPGYCVDLFLLLTGKNPKLIKLYEKAHKGMDLLSFFISHQWIFHNDNTKNLYQNLDYRDKDLFNFDIKSMDWDKFLFYIPRYYRTYILKQPISNLVCYDRKLNRMKTFTNLLYTCIICFVTWWFVR